MENQRRSTRRDCSVPIDSGRGNIFSRTQTVDLSQGGIGFLSDHDIPLNQQIMIELDLEEKGNPVFVVGKVKWVKFIPENGQYRIGMTFVDVVQGSQSRLNKYFKR